MTAREVIAKQLRPWSARSMPLATAERINHDAESEADAIIAALVAEGYTVAKQDGGDW